MTTQAKPPIAPAARDTKHLQLRGQTWLCILAVPRALRAILGKDKVLRSLKTGDLRVAQRRRHAVVADFHKMFDVAAKAASSGPKSLVAEAMEYRALASQMEKPDDNNAYGPDDMIVDRAEAIERTHGLAKAQRFFVIARGQATPIVQHLEDWLREGNYTLRSRMQHTATVQELEVWCDRNEVATDLEAITKKAAGQFATAALKEGDVLRSTVNRKLSTLRSYWRWLEQKGLVVANPWLGQTLPAPRLQQEDQGKSREFTHAETVALLSGPATQLLHDVMRAAALTGARIGSLAKLTVGDVKDGMAFIRQDKTASGRRRVPIHSALAPIVERRVAGKAPAAFLFDELTTDKQAERTSHVSKLFTRYRQSLGITEKASPGQRRSNVTMHSWRNWFITEARRAGQTEDVVQQVVGQKPQSTMARVYFGGSLEETLRACVEAVHLPPHPAPIILPPPVIGRPRAARPNGPGR